MVVTDEGAVPGQVKEQSGIDRQWDQASLETLRGLVKIEVASQVHLWSDTLEKTKAKVDHRLDEFHGVVGSLDNNHGTALQSLDDRQSHSEDKLADLAVDLHKCGATGRGELRRACIELDNKITALGERDDSEKRELNNKIEREAQALRDQHQDTATDIYAKIQDLQQQVINGRSERQAIESRCMHYTDRSVQAAMASKELEARFQAVRDSVDAVDRKLQQADASIRADLAAYTQELCASLNARCDDMAQLADRRHEEISGRMEKCIQTAREAAASADKAVHLVDESLHEKVHTASRNLRSQIEAAATRSINAGHSEAQVKEMTAERTAKRAQELQAGFYALVAREALDTEIRSLVERATRRLQVVADDLAMRSDRVQEHVVAAEERLNVALEFAHRQAREIEAQTIGDLPPAP